MLTQWIFVCVLLYIGPLLWSGDENKKAYIYSNKEETSIFHGSVTFDPDQISTQK